MTKVIFDISMSLDGFVTASNVRPEEPMGDGGQRLHDWAFGEDERNRELLTESMNFVGEIVAGRPHEARKGGLPTNGWRVASSSSSA